MNKVAVGLFGIHYCDNFNHWMGWVHNINYKATYENNKNKIYDLYDVDYYSSTYYSDVLQNLMNDFSFEQIKLKKISNIKEHDISKNYKKRNIVFKETIELVLNSNKKYDFVILTRYDCNFLQTIEQLNINHKKINFLCRAKCGDDDSFVDDNFYIIPYNLLNIFYKKINDIDEHVWSHDYHKYFDKDIINYMVDGAYYSHEIKFYQIHRIPIN